MLVPRAQGWVKSQLPCACGRCGPCCTLGSAADDRQWHVLGAGDGSVAARLLSRQGRPCFYSMPLPRRTAVDPE